MGVFALPQASSALMICSAPDSGSRSERQLQLYMADALAEGPSALLGLDVAPSTLLPSYDPDTGLVLLTGKVSWNGLAGCGAGSDVAKCLTFIPYLPSVPQGDTRVFLYEVIPEAPFFLECNSFTSPDPHKVMSPSPLNLLSPSWTARFPCPLVAMCGSAGANGGQKSQGSVPGSRYS